MRKIKATIFILFIICSSIAAESQNKQSLMIETGLNFRPGLFYNWNWEPGYNGSAITASLNYQNNKFIMGGGLEAGYSYLGFDIFVPIKTGFVIAETEKIEFLIQAVILPGLLLTRPYPYFMIGIETSASLKWNINDKISFSLFAGPRYTAIPVYSINVAPENELGLNAGVSSTFIINQSKN
ncbi:MAG: hypothetical protein PQJ46_08560 [Spirochaetales bacterium]|nr:hypothetical protein [Spirochaetales bacterium]